MHNREYDMVLGAIRKKWISIRKAAKACHKSQNTIRHDLRNPPRIVTTRTKLSREEETQLINYITDLTKNSCFIMTRYDLRLMVKHYLDEKGKHIFPNNFPGVKWVKRFVIRHPTMHAILEKKNVPHFGHLMSSIKQNLTNNIWIYQEMDITDRGTITHRFQKYSRSFASAILCVNANGNLLPPYMVHKQETEILGWIDVSCFHEFFFHILLPNLKKNPGKKTVMGDTHSSHISFEIWKACRDHDIYLISLPTYRFFQPIYLTYTGTVHHLTPRLTTQSFPTFFQKEWRAISQETFQKGFEQAYLSWKKEEAKQ